MICGQCHRMPCSWALPSLPVLVPLLFLNTVPLHAERGWEFKEHSSDRSHTHLVSRRELNTAVQLLRSVGAIGGHHCPNRPGELAGLEAGDEHGMSWLKRCVEYVESLAAKARVRQRHSWGSNRDYAKEVEDTYKEVVGIAGPRAAELDKFKEIAEGDQAQVMVHLGRKLNILTKELDHIKSMGSPAEERLKEHRRSFKSDTEDDRPEPKMQDDFDGDSTSGKLRVEPFSAQSTDFDDRPNVEKITAKESLLERELQAKDREIETLRSRAKDREIESLRSQLNQRSHRLQPPDFEPLSD